MNAQPAGCAIFGSAGLRTYARLLGAVHAGGSIDQAISSQPLPAHQTLSFTKTRLSELMSLRALRASPWRGFIGIWFAPGRLQLRVTIAELILRTMISGNIRKNRLPRFLRRHPLI